MRWMAPVADYNFTVKYLPSLSRHAVDPQCYTESVNILLLNAMTNSISAINHSNDILDPALVANINTINLKDKVIKVIDSKSLVDDQINSI